MLLSWPRSEIAAVDCKIDVFGLLIEDDSFRGGFDIFYDLQFIYRCYDAGSLWLVDLLALIFLYAILEVFLVGNAID